MPTPHEIVEKCKIALKDRYGPQFRGLLLYGSMAREEADVHSDIDLLVLLDGSFDFHVELRRVIDILYPIQLESDRLISAKPVYVSDFERGSVQLFRNAKKEGILV